MTIILALTGLVFAQTKKRNSRKPVTESKQEKVTTDEVAKPVNAVKKNERTPAEDDKKVVVEAKTVPVYFYTFAQPNFTVSDVSIEHDETGKGKITFLKQTFSEPITDPIQLSPTALERIKNVWNALDFLNSNESYQYVKDYSHLGTMKFTIKKDGRERTASFNWTENKDAKALADEYRKIGNQYIWLFDFSVARENQPLETPRMMDALESLIKRNEVSDAAQMIPFFKELTDDERVPLITRNHAKRLIEKIEKQVAKMKKDN